MAEKCLRTLLIGYVDYEEGVWNERVKAGALDTPEGKDALEKDITISMIVGIADPLKHGIKNAVQTLKKAGVTTRMVTGDNLQTAKAIAKEAGILA